MKGGADDPKGLIFEAYRIPEITEGECRSIFLDWALSLPLETDTGTAIRALLKSYEGTAPEHPMTLVMKEGLRSMAAPRRRGGWRSRPRN
ncbi:MAG: hypothetical protein HKN30_05355 [Sulfitobacter sp.]|nr:hypothetical protein [Sulfitobacter sp.]